MNTTRQQNNRPPCPLGCLVFVCILFYMGTTAWASQPTRSTSQHGPAQQPINESAAAAGDSPKDGQPLLKLSLPRQPTKLVSGQLADGAGVISGPLSRNTFDLNPDPVSRPEMDPIPLFDPELGMKGFMRHHWLTQQFGLSAGLGLAPTNEPRQYLESLDIDAVSDNLLLGMGFLLAF